jgi:4-aminobutyrate aminotransferase/(S)-3-amino-2-methylpropionate transaminase
MFAYEHAGITPDLVTLAKGLADGFPVSAVVGAANVMDAPEPGGLGGTYAGNPIACAAALAVLDVFEREHIVGRAETLGRILREGLTGLATRYAQIGDVRGLGAMLGFELVKDSATREPAVELTSAIIDESRNRGLLVIRCGIHKNVIRMLPPLTTTESEAARAIQILDEAIAQVMVRT